MSHKITENYGKYGSSDLLGCISKYLSSKRSKSPNMRHQSAGIPPKHIIAALNLL